MESVLKLVDKANKSLQVADHLTYITYPLLNDVKLIVTITENLYNSYVCAMDAFLAYERLYKRIPSLPEDFNSRFDIFKTKIVKRYNIDREHVLLMDDLKKIIDHRRKSPIEFIKKDKFIICSDTYKMKTINYDKIKEYLNKSKPFFTRLNKVLRKNDTRC